MDSTSESGFVRNDDTGNLESLFAALQAGDPNALDRVINLHGPTLLRVVRSRLHKSLRVQFDSMDFTQDVWKSFAKQCDGLKFESKAALSAYLNRMVINKVREAARKLQTSKKYGLPMSGDANSQNQLDLAQSKSPSPSTLLNAEDCKQRLAAGRGAGFRRALDLKMQGYTLEEIAAEVGVNVRTLKRVFATLKGDPNRRPDD